MSAAATDTAIALLAEQVRKRPAAPAIHHGAETISFAGLDALARRAAHGLAVLGVGQGDRVALWLPNTPAYLALWLACARLGAIAVAVNTRFRSAEVGDIVARSGARVMALWPGFRAIDFLAILSEIEPEALARLESLILYDEDGALDADGAAVPAAVGHCRRVAWRDLVDGPAETAERASPEAGLNIFTTSGTTSRPKFVLHSQASITRHARIVARGFGYAADGGPILQAMPFCGVFGFCMASAAIAAGVPSVLMSAFDAAEAYRLIERHQVQHSNATDDAILALLNASPHENALPSIRYMGFAIFNASLADLPERAAARGLKLVGLYGMSEVQALYARQDLDAPLAERRQGGGKLMSPDSRVRVRDPESGKLLPHGEAGELELAGPSLMSGYWGDEAATRAAMSEDGFVRTGDLGYTTAEDRFVYLSRMGDVLRLGGFLVSPAEIESHIQEHASVAGAQVVGVATEKGLRPFAFVTLAPGQGLDEAGLIQHCLAGLARFKAPVRVLALDEFPTTKSANGTKIQRGKLREMAEAAMRADAGSVP